jgi:hypothetical protein
MKRFICAAAALLVLSTGFAAAKEQPVVPDTYDYDSLVESLTGVSAPFVNGNFIVFTAPNTARFVGIVFDFEHYKTIHPFRLHKLIDADGKTKDSWFFYLLDRPRNMQSLSYRLVVDGLWTTDPTNSDTFYDTSAGILLSRFNINVVDPPITEVESDNLTKFVCNAPSGEKIRLGGTFTNWDSWIYEMAEVAPGRYEISIPLPQGTYYYNYYHGITPFTDSTNPLKGYTSDGRIASRIEIK